MVERMIDLGIGSEIGVLIGIEKRKEGIIVIGVVVVVLCFIVEV